MLPNNIIGQFSSRNSLSLWKLGWNFETTFEEYEIYTDCEMRWMTYISEVDQSIELFSTYDDPKAINQSTSIPKAHVQLKHEANSISGIKFVSGVGLSRLQRLYIDLRSQTKSLTFYFLFFSLGKSKILFHKNCFRN